MGWSASSQRFSDRKKAHTGTYSVPHLPRGPPWLWEDEQWMVDEHALRLELRGRGRGRGSRRPAVESREAGK
jgi:hypothetical protein